jgi:glucose-1-phosphate thymidylyltransferase
VKITYAVQERPEGIAQAFLVGRDFVGADPCALILGDNIFFGHNLQATLAKCASEAGGATIFGYHVKDPSAYGVAELSRSGEVLDIVEKPAQPRSNIAIPGLYFYDGDVCAYVDRIKPSARGELEISDLNRLYLRERKLRLQMLGRGTAWLDTGTPDSLIQAGNFIQTIQQRQGLQVACPEEVAFRMGWIGPEEVKAIAARLRNTAYGEYLDTLARGALEY